METQEQTERFLAETDPRYVTLCLDTGHLAYRRADSVALIRRYPDRIGYVHIKQMDPAIVARADREDLAFGQAVAHGRQLRAAGRAARRAVRRGQALSELDAETCSSWSSRTCTRCDFDLPEPDRRPDPRLPARPSASAADGR